MEEKYIEKIEKYKDISNKNKVLILQFLKKCTAKNVGLKRREKYAWILRNISKMFQTDFEDVNKKQDLKMIEDVVARINSMEYAEWTKRDYRMTIKRFWKDMFSDGIEYPKLVRWIPMKMNDKYKEKERRKDILTPEEIDKLVACASNPMWKAFIKLMFELGPRIEETQNIQNSDIEWGDASFDVTISGKTGTRTVTCVDSSPRMFAWRDSHPKKDDKDSYFFCSRVSGEKLSYSSISLTLQMIAEKANIEKSVNPHAFRRASATYWSQFLNSQEMCDKYGWVYGSDVLRHYVYRGSEALKSKIAHLYGLNNGNDKQRMFRPIKCKRCDFLNDSSSRMCLKCGLTFTPGDTMITNKKRKDMVRELVMERVMVKNPKLKEMIEEATIELSDKIRELLENGGA